MNIVVATNRKYLCYAAVTIKSLCEQNKDVHLDIYVLHRELNQNDISVLKEVFSNYDATLIPFYIDLRKLKGIPEFKEFWTMEACFRLLLPWELEKTIDRVLYLDVDIIVNGSLKEFYESDFEGNDLIGCIEVFRHTEDQFEGHHKEMFLPRLKEGFEYINSGVLLMNLKQIRTNYTFNSYLEAVHEWDNNIPYVDQDLLNWVHYKKIKYVDNKYNYMAYLLTLLGQDNKWIADNDIKILHYAGYTKPWIHQMYHIEANRIWWEYAKETSFYHEILENYLQNTLTDDRYKKDAETKANEFRTIQQELNKYISLTEELYKALQDSISANNEYIEFIQGLKCNE